MNQKQRMTILGMKMTAVSAGVVGLVSNWKPAVITLFDFLLALVATVSMIFLIWIVCYQIVL
ncbi:MAG TPA: hypothetical protein VJZ75_02380 [Candidatus Bathyarchaeia archaeon]|nr:hypothetical protein [Candidatus Bathyarchaeia archaeon]